jgi:hypothetical protein
VALGVEDVMEVSGVPEFEVDEGVRVGDGVGDTGDSGTGVVLEVDGAVSGPVFCGVVLDVVGVGPFGLVCGATLPGLALQSDPASPQSGSLQHLPTPLQKPQ